jgi:hypothetical protein
MDLPILRTDSLPAAEERAARVIGNVEIVRKSVVARSDVFGATKQSRFAIHT